MKVVSSRFFSRLNASAIALAAAGVAQAQSTAGSPESGLEEVVVTATRREENIQDVPMNVTAITGDQLEKYNFTRFEDIASLSPGLRLDSTAQGEVTSLRGVSTSAVSGAPPAADIYLNESSVPIVVAFSGMYDIGQIEVLHGPQGTLRGSTAPAGSITIATRRPSMNEFGVSSDLTLSERRKPNVTAAVSVPIVEDVFAIRVAGLYERNDNGGTRDVATHEDAEADVKSARVSALYKPTDFFEVFGMYQYMRDTRHNLVRVEGSGMGYNGPAIDGNDNLAVQGDSELHRVTTDVASLIARLDLGSEATLKYIGGYRKYTDSKPPGHANDDPGNAILSYSTTPTSFSIIPVSQWLHELRLDSAGADRFWDYTLGVYHENSRTDVRQSNPTIMFPGAFGDPATPSAAPTGPLNSRYVSNLNLSLYGGDVRPFGKGNDSVFASSTFHLPTRTDVRLGLRRVWARSDNNFIVSLTPANIGAAVPFPTSLCSTFVPGSSASPDYPTTCDIPFAGASPAIEAHTQRKFREWVYDVSVVQHLTDDVMAYVSFGHSWRPPGASQGNVPVQYVVVDPEESNNYEIGFKSELADGRIRFNAAIFQQDFTDFNAAVTQIPFLDASGIVQNAFSITYNGDARVQGVEADLSAIVTDNWSAGISASYAKGEFKDAASPCRDSNFDGAPDTGTPVAADFTSRGINVATCTSNGPISGVPKWNGTLQTEYTVAFGDAEGYVRGLVAYSGSSLDVGTGQQFDDYIITNLYVGARNIFHGLDLGLYGKNLFDTVELTENAPLAATGGLDSGYNRVNYLRGREVGISAHYSFGGE